MRNIYRKWNTAFLVLICAVLAGVASLNYFVDPFGYFSFQSGDYEKIDFPVDTTYFQRELKAQHVLRFGEEYDAFLLGGSKAGSYRTEKLQELDGYCYYNMYELGGSFYEYELETAFLIEHASPKKIILNISGGEVRFLKRNQKDMTNQIPAVMTGESVFLETLDFLFKDVSEAFDRLWERMSDKPYYELTSGGNRNLEKYYERVEEDWEKFTQKYVLEAFDKHMKTLFANNRNVDYYDESIESIRNIKKMCDENGVELLVIVAPSFIGEMCEHDSEGYREFLNRIAWITDYWDFSGYHEIDLNPYNFYNEGHFYYEVADLMIDTMKGTDSYPGFGVFVTKENAAAHIAGREADYKRLQQEYLETGTIQLQGQEDESCLLK